MWFPAISGTIDRRILINYQVDQDVVRRYLPAPFQPKLAGGKAIVGVCLIRLKHVRPKGFPAGMGISSENGAHRIAVEWEEEGTLKEGVFVPRRDTSSRANVLAGGRIFPGRHQRAEFSVEEGQGRYSVAFRSEDGTSLTIQASDTTAWTDTSVFPDLMSASRFMERGAIGYSPTRKQGTFDGLELRTSKWQVAPLGVAGLRSSFFMDRSVFPEGSVRFDSAMVMKDIAHEWRAARTLTTEWTSC